MAGGGLRMKPLQIFSKSVITLQNSTIEEIIDKFMSENYNKIIIPTGFKSNLLIKHLKSEGYSNIKFSKRSNHLERLVVLSLLKENFLIHFFI